jgi:hypothetical protein
VIAINFNMTFDESYVLGEQFDNSIINNRNLHKDMNSKQ